MAVPNTIAPFRLRDQRGRPLGAADLWQRREMVLALLHPPGCAPCDALERELDARADRLSSEIAGALVVRPGNGPLPRLVDEEHAVWRELGLPPDAAALVTADRYGRVLGARDPHLGDPAGLADEALSLVEYAQMQCPECGVATPGWE